MFPSATVDKRAMQAVTQRSSTGRLFRFLATLVRARRADSPVPQAQVRVFDEGDDAGRPKAIRRLSPHAEVNSFWNPAPPRRRAS